MYLKRTVLFLTALAVQCVRASRKPGDDSLAEATRISGTSNNNQRSFIPDMLDAFIPRFSVPEGARFPGSSILKSFSRDGGAEGDGGTVELPGTGIVRGVSRTFFNGDNRSSGQSTRRPIIRPWTELSGPSLYVPENPEREYEFITPRPTRAGPGQGSVVPSIPDNRNTGLGGVPSIPDNRNTGLGGAPSIPDNRNPGYGTVPSIPSNRNPGGSGQGYPPQQHGLGGTRSASGTSNHRLLSVARAANALGFNVYRSLREKHNAIISPIGAFVALNMLYLGTGGSTAETMSKILNYDVINTGGSSVHAMVRDLVNEISATRGSTLKMANAALVHREYPLEESYTRQLAEFYNAILKRTDFSLDLRLVARELNGWVSKETLGGIQTLLGDPVAPMTALVLMNAMFFSGKWDSPFDPKNTKPARFYNRGTAPSMVPMMHKQGSFPVTCDNTLDAYVLELHYTGTEISMLIFLPRREQRDLQSLEEELTVSSLERVVSTLNTRSLNVSLPKFQLEDKNDLLDVLKSLGLTQISDLTGISSRGDLYVGQITHRAAIRVTEEGTTASTSTGVAVDVKGYSCLPRDFAFVVNRPFIFVILHEPTQLVLFMGRINRLSS